MPVIQISRKFFKNEYGMYVITGGYGWNTPDTPFEVAVLKGTEDNWVICYDTPITNDVIGYLSSDEVDALEAKIRELPWHGTSMGNPAVGFMIHEMNASDMNGGN